MDFLRLVSFCTIIFQPLFPKPWWTLLGLIFFQVISTKLTHAASVFVAITRSTILLHLLLFSSWALTIFSFLALKLLNSSLKLLRVSIQSGKSSSLLFPTESSSWQCWDLLVMYYTILLHIPWFSCCSLVSSYVLLHTYNC